MPPKRGPKSPLDDSPLPFERTGNDVDDFERFCAEYIRVERNRPMVIRPWQRAIVEMIWSDPRPKMAALSIGRGNAKSSLASALCLMRLYLEDDFSIDLLAFDERQARIIGGICGKMISRHPELNKRAQPYVDRITRGTSELFWLPATAAALEGRMADWTVCDEGGRIDREVFEVAAFSAAKKPHAQLFLIGTPGPKPDNVLAEVRSYCQSHPEDLSRRYLEFGADQWRDHELDCDDHGGGVGSGCLTAANPALDDWLTRDSLLSNLPPKSSIQHWRRVSLVQFWATGSDEPALPPEVWNDLSTGDGIPAGEKVVLSFDGSYSGTDATVLLAATVSKTPHMDVVQVWQRPNPADAEYKIPILEVEQAIRDACRKWNVVEVACDSYRWQRSIEVLKSEGLPMVDFPQSISRMSAATADFLQACRNQQLSHSGHPILAEHLGNAVLSEDNRGGRLVKASKSRSAGRIDAAICAVMARSRASWHATKPSKGKRAWSFA